MSLALFMRDMGQPVITSNWTVAPADPERYGKNAITISYHHVRLGRHVLTHYAITMDDFRRALVSAAHNHEPYLDLREATHAA